MKLQAFFSASMLLIAFAFVNGFKPNPPVKAKTVTKIETKEISFVKFLSHFEKTALPYSVTLSDLNKEDHNNLLQNKIQKVARKNTQSNNLISRTKYIPELLMGNFSRIGPPMIEPIVRFFPNDKMVAVVYSASYGYGSQHKSYNLVVYDTKGNILFPEKKHGLTPRSGFNIGLNSTQKTITCQIDASGHLWKNTFKNVYEKNVKEHEQHKHQAIAYNLEDTEIWKINDKGHVVELKEYPDLTRAGLD